MPARSKETVDLYYKHAFAKYQETVQRNRDLDTKAAGVNGLAVALGGVAALVLRLSPTVPETNGLSNDILIAGGLFLVALFATLLCSIRTLVLRKWQIHPTAASLARHMHDSQYDFLQLTEWTASGLSDATYENFQTLKLKARWFSASVITLSVSVFLLAALAVSAYV